MYRHFATLWICSEELTNNAYVFIALLSCLARNVFVGRSLFILWGAIFSITTTFLEHFGYWFDPHINELLPREVVCRSAINQSHGFRIIKKNVRWLLSFFKLSMYLSQPFYHLTRVRLSDIFRLHEASWRTTVVVYSSYVRWLLHI